MLSSEIAKERIGDRLREAEATRLARQTRRGRAGASAARSRKVTSGLLAALVWPIKH